jgi:hypothetical protein
MARPSGQAGIPSGVQQLLTFIHSDGSRQPVTSSKIQETRKKTKDQRKKLKVFLLRPLQNLCALSVKIFYAKKSKEVLRISVQTLTRIIYKLDIIYPESLCDWEKLIFYFL